MDILCHRTRGHVSSSFVPYSIALCLFLFAALPYLFPAASDAESPSAREQSSDTGTADTAPSPAVTEEETFSTDTPAVQVAVIPVVGDVDFGLARFIERAIEQAEAEGCSMVILEIDTFGGRVDSALEISKIITGIRDIKTVGFTVDKAISAGAIISLACSEMVMKSHTTVGDCAPLMMTQEGPKMLGEKFQSPLRAEFRKLAEKNGYPVRLAEAMVTEEMEVLEVTTDTGTRYLTSRELEELSEDEKSAITSKKVIVGEGELLTMHAQEAHRYGFAKVVVEDEDELFSFYNINPDAVIRIPITWSETWVRFLDKWAGVLFIIGLLGLYMEFKMPGFGLPGLVAVIAFGLLFGSKYMVGLANYPELLLFTAGVALLAVEVFLLPGFGLAGLSGIFLIILSLYLASQPFVIPKAPWDFKSVESWVIHFGLSFFAFCIIAFILTKYLPKTPLAHIAAVTATLRSAEGFSAASADLSSLVGAEGLSFSVLRPAGKGMFGDKLLDIVSEGDYIKKSRKIKITRVEGNRIFVREV